LNIAAHLALLVHYMNVNVKSDFFQAHIVRIAHKNILTFL